ncbi:MAG: acyltransferase [Clostridia bacterium]|nr:acyltransferase [Clostridia bacterium]
MKNFLQADISKKSIQWLQILCAICVLLHHLGEQGVQWLRFFVPMGYYPVAFFFFCSGYGLVKSYQDKEYYLEHFFSNRMLKIIFPFFVANVVYFIVKIVIHNTEEMWSLKRFLFGGAVVKYSWYVIAIIFLYLVYYIAFRILGKRNIKGAIMMVAVGILFWILVMIFMRSGEHRYVSSPCFVLGCLLGVGREKKEILYSRHGAGIFSSVLMIVFIFCSNATEQDVIRILCEIFGCIFFTLVLTSSDKYINKIPWDISFLYKYNYEFYLYQGLWIILLKQLIDFSILYSALVLGGTVVTAIAVGMFDKKCIGIIRNCVRKKEA